MKMTVGGFPVEGTPAEMIELLTGLNRGEPQHDSASLTPKQREAYEALVGHPHGAHYTVLADELKMDAGTVNGRLAGLVINAPHLVERVGAGVYRAVIA